MESEMDVELRFHIEAFAEDLVRSGMSREEAVRRGRIEFGAVERAKEEYREARGVNFIDSILQDLRYVLRVLRRPIRRRIGARNDTFAWRVVVRRRVSRRPELLRRYSRFAGRDGDRSLPARAAGDEGRPNGGAAL
jgi:hypothetical protein